MAHRVRGFAEGQGLRGLIARTLRYAIPLLAAAIRKSERTALAMDAKAFGAGPERTYYRQMRLAWRDAAFVLALGAYTLAVYAVALHLGLADLQWVPQV